MKKLELGDKLALNTRMETNEDDVLYAENFVLLLLLCIVICEGEMNTKEHSSTRTILLQSSDFEN